MTASGAAATKLALLIEIRTEPARREDPDRNERRGRILDVFDRGVRRRAGAAAATATGEFQSVVLGASTSAAKPIMNEFNNTGSRRNVGFCQHGPPGSMAPEQTPERPMPANNGFGAHDGDGLQEPRKDPGDGGDAPPVARLEARPRCAPPKHDDLLAEQGIFRHEPGASTEGIPHQAEEDSEELAKHGQTP
jgi:hypothetical protein